MISSRTLRVNDDLTMVHDDKRTFAWFYSDRRELLFGIEQIDASFCLELNVFEVSQGVLIFYNIYLSQLSHFVSN